MAVTCTVLRIPKAEADAEPYRTYLDALCSLSQAWADERVCPSYSPNAAEDFCERAVYAALDGKEIIGYAMGHKTILTAASSLNAAGVGSSTQLARSSLKNFIIAGAASR